MASILRYRPVMLPGIEFYNEDGSFTEETTSRLSEIFGFFQKIKE